MGPPPTNYFLTGKSSVSSETEPPEATSALARSLKYLITVALRHLQQQSLPAPCPNQTAGERSPGQLQDFAASTTCPVPMLLSCISPDYGKDESATTEMKTGRFASQPKSESSEPRPPPHGYLVSLTPLATTTHAQQQLDYAVLQPRPPYRTI